MVDAASANARAVSIGRDIIAAQDRMHHEIGAFDYSGYGWEQPYRIRDYRREDQTVFKSDDRAARDTEWENFVAEYVGLAALASLEGFLTASDRLGKWMSAAIDDPKVCEEMKSDIRAWFDAMPATPNTETE